ncbi:hypothetical protein PMIN06_000083 [Paraphaeosphaeria minitans]
MYSIPNHALGCRCSQCMLAHYPVSEDPSGPSSDLHSPGKIAEATSPASEPKTTCEKGGFKVLVGSPSIALSPSLLHHSVGAAKTSSQASTRTHRNNHTDTYKPAMPEIEWVIEEMTSDDDFQSVDWSNDQSDTDGKTTTSDDFVTAPFNIPLEEAKLDIHGKSIPHDATLIVSPTTTPVAATKSMDGKAPATDFAATAAAKTQKVMANQDDVSAAEPKNVGIVPAKALVSHNALAASSKTLKMAAMKSKVTPSSKPKQAGVALGKAPVANTATDTASKTVEVEVKQYNVFSNSQLRESVEQAMRETFPTELVDAMMADLNGEFALDTEIVNAKTICRLLDGIDQSHRKYGVASLAELYPKRLSKPKAETEVKAETLHLKERLAALHVRIEQFKKRKEQRSKKDAANKDATKTETVTAQVCHRRSEDAPPEDAEKHLAQEETALKSPLEKGRMSTNLYQDVQSPCLEMSSKLLVVLLEDDKENADPNAKPW